MWWTGNDFLKATIRNGQNIASTEGYQARQLPEQHCSGFSSYRNAETNDALEFCVERSFQRIQMPTA
jgi:hypothetical protein